MSDLTASSDPAVGWFRSPDADILTKNLATAIIGAHEAALGFWSDSGFTPGPPDYAPGAAMVGTATPSALQGAGLPATPTPSFPLAARGISLLTVGLVVAHSGFLFSGYTVQVLTNATVPDNKNTMKKRPQRCVGKRAQSVSPVIARPRGQQVKKDDERRTQSLSPFNNGQVSELDNGQHAQQSSSTPGNMNTQFQQGPEKDVTIPQGIQLKAMRNLATKKREFIKLRKSLITLQNSVLEQYAAIKDLETRAGLVTGESIGDIRVLSVNSWPAHDLLLLVRDDLEIPVDSEISGTFGPQVLQQLQSHLNPIPDEVLQMGAEVMARRLELLRLLRGKHRADRSSYATNLEWKTKNTEFDKETAQIHQMVADTAENLKTKINFSLGIAKIPWLDRETLKKKIDRLLKENSILQSKIEECSKKEAEEGKEPLQTPDNTPACQAMTEELAKERAAREALKEVVSAAESMLRVARGRIATLERQLKETKAELDAAKKKQKDLEQLYRHRETSYDARSKKLLEVSKTGEVTIEALSRQRDALEMRVKELHEQAEAAENVAKIREAEQRARAETLQAKVAEQEKNTMLVEARVVEQERRIKELEEELQVMRERSARLVDMERRRCLDCVPSKEKEPSDRETEIWKELQVNRVALARAEEELQQSRADKDSFLNSLSRIAKGEGVDNVKDQMAAELLDRQRQIVKLQHVIDEQKENEKLMEQSMAQYENQLASLRLEVKRLRNYDCYAKEVSYPELQTELLELHMQVETLSRERTTLVTAAATRALMLERHERSAELFARIVRARRELAALLEDNTGSMSIEESDQKEVSRSLSLVCANAADTWTALRAERARVIRLESAVLAQSLQLQREGRVRTQLERCRAVLEREVLRLHHTASSERSIIKNPSLVSRSSF